MPSTTIIDEHELSTGLPLISIVIDNNDLKDILTNLLKTGRKWERPVYISYFERGNLVFATGAGLRLHGGKSRLHSPVHSFRLYFRNVYGHTGRQILQPHILQRRIRVFMSKEAEVAHIR